MASETPHFQLLIYREKERRQSRGVKQRAERDQYFAQCHLAAESGTMTDCHVLSRFFHPTVFPFTDCMQTC